jgi:hypothetical protein
LRGSAAQGFCGLGKPDLSNPFRTLPGGPLASVVLSYNGGPRIPRANEIVVNVAGKCLTNYSAREQPLDAPIRAEGAKPPGNPWRPGGSGGWERLGARVSVISIALFFALVFGTRLTRINIKASIGCGQRARPRPDQARCSFGAAHSSSEPALLNPFAYKQTRPYSERLLVSRNQPNGPEPLSGRAV